MFCCCYFICFIFQLFSDVDLKCVGGAIQAVAGLAGGDQAEKWQPFGHRNLEKCAANKPDWSRLLHSGPGANFHVLNVKENTIVFKNSCF